MHDQRTRDRTGDPARDRPRSTGRREVIRALLGLGVGGIAVAAPGTSRLLRHVVGSGEALAQGCELSRELTEGPYYVEGAPLRRNVIEGRPGAVLWLSLTVLDSGSCRPLPGATVEIWHADAGGSYSGVGELQNARFLRGRQAVGAAGVATFRTIYPGWYPGRTPHVHVKVSVAGTEVHTGQLFFDEGLTAAVYAREPYRSRGAQDTTNAADGIFANGGSASILTIAPRGAGYWGKTALVVAT
jgi:protocatechuate 3,4-dioxygenase beta subunit